MSQRAAARVVLDCNVVLQAVLTARGPSYRCVRLVEERRVLLLLSADVLAEFRDVLTRPFVREQKPEITPERVDAILSRLQYDAELIRDVPDVFDFPRDPKDAPYVNLVAAAAADFLVTRDGDLLDLASGHSASAKQFRQLTQNRTRILDPVSFLREFESPIT